jgi:hypothetical protein
MRQELINTLRGSYPEVAKGHYGILRRVQRDEDNLPVRCPCRSTTSKESDKTYFCPICFTTGFLFVEEYILFYHALGETTFADTQRRHITSAGISQATFDVFYFEYNEDIHNEDRILEVALTDEGDIITPINYLSSYRIDEAWCYRGDNGKLEYWKIWAHKEELKYLTTPNHGT